MTVYVDIVAAMNFAVDLLLLLAANRLSGYPQNGKRAVLGAALGGLYAGCCLVPGLSFLGNVFWRTVALGAMGTVSFGISLSALRRTLIFLFLSMALSGAAAGFSFGRVISVAVGVLTVLLLCRFGFTGPVKLQSYLPVELFYEDKALQITAMYDTGNTLKDPVTGNSVLVVGAEVATALTGLTTQQLKDPVGSIGLIPGLRLVPYRTVDRDDGLLLALRLPLIRVGTWKGSGLVAFAPYKLSTEGAYQALTGGCM